MLLGGATVAVAQVRLVSTKQGNGDPPSAPVYEDRVIEGLAPQGADEGQEEHPYNLDGWPRFLRLETRLGTQPFNDRTLSAGISAAAGVETPNHGVISIDANYAPDEASNAITLRQRDLPVNGGWQVNNEIGVTTPIAPGIMRLPSRVFVPSTFIRGGSTEWLNPGRNVQWLASSGEPGRHEGYPVSGFRSLAGNITTVGAQAGAGSWSMAVRHAHADGISQFDNPTQPSDFIDSDSSQVAVRQESSNHSVQANLVEVRSSDAPGTRRGVWVDGELKQGTSLYGGGFYRMDPNLSWSGQGMASDIEGAYVRGSWRARQWSAESSVDAMRAVSRSEDTGVLVSATGRWRYSRTLSFGAGTSVRHFKGNAGTGYAEVRWQNDWGNSGLRAEYTGGQSPRARRLALDHGWLLPQGWELNTSLIDGNGVRAGVRRLV